MFQITALCFLFPAAGPVAEQKPLVEVQLLTDTKQVVPGGRFRLGLLFRIAESCHIYWENPGDAGLAPKIRWKLPEGFVAGPVFWPVPERLEEPGGLFVNSYTNEVLLFSLVQAPVDLAQLSVAIGVEANWLVCKKICIQEKIATGIELPVGKERSGRSSSQEVFEKYAARVPRPAGEVGEFKSEARWARDNMQPETRRGVVVLESAEPGRTFVRTQDGLQWFAYPSEHLICEDYHLDGASSGPERLVLHLLVRKFDDGSPWPATWGGVLRGRMIRAEADTIDYAVSLEFTR